MMRSLKRCWAIIALAACAPMLMAPSGNAPPVTAILCTTACNISTIKVGQSAYIIKGTGTSRASTVALTLDPDLQFTNIPINESFVFTLTIGVITTTTTAQSFQYDMGSAAVSPFGWCYLGGPTTTGAGNTTGWNAGVGNAGSGFQAPAANFTASLANQMNCSGAFKMSSAGTFGLFWAQAVSNANTTSISGGSQSSALYVTRIT